jgi:hypothetical protein
MLLAQPTPTDCDNRIANSMIVENNRLVTVGASTAPVSILC